VARVRARQPELDAANAALVVLLPEPVADLAPVARQEGWTGPVLADPDRGVYRSYGLGRLPRHRVFTPKTLLFYFGFMLRGRWPQPPGRDVRQQGGDFVVDSGGIVRLAYVGRSPDDRPTVDDLIGCLRSVAGMPARSS
jgi:hypothetical protein